MESIPFHMSPLLNGHDDYEGMGLDGRIELTALKYEVGEQTATDKLFFGGSNAFRKNYLRKIRKKAF